MNQPPDPSEPNRLQPPSSYQSAEGTKMGVTKVGTLDFNMAAVLAYATPLCLVGVIASAVWLNTEPKSNKFVRFCSLQSLLLFGVWAVIGIACSIFSIVPFIGMLGSAIGSLSTLGWALVSALLMYKAYRGEMFLLPYIGQFADSNS